MHLYQSWDDCFNGPADHLKAVAVVLSHYAGTHKRKNGHNVVHHFLLVKNGEKRIKKQLIKKQLN